MKNINKFLKREHQFRLSCGRDISPDFNEFKKDIEKVYYIARSSKLEVSHDYSDFKEALKDYKRTCNLEADYSEIVELCGVLQNKETGEAYTNWIVYRRIKK